MVPGGFLTFADHPLYATYELAPRVMGFSALNDQQLAGAFMKVGNIPVIWSVIAVMFVRWWKQERASDEVGGQGRTREPRWLRRGGSAQRHPGTGYAAGRARVALGRARRGVAATAGGPVLELAPRRWPAPASTNGRTSPR